MVILQQQHPLPPCTLSQRFRFHFQRHTEIVNRKNGSVFVCLCCVLATCPFSSMYIMHSKHEHQRRIRLSVTTLAPRRSRRSQANQQLFPTSINGPKKSEAGNQNPEIAMEEVARHLAHHQITPRHNNPPSSSQKYGYDPG